MKTTLNLGDRLVTRIKPTAGRQRTTMSALVETALRLATAGIRYPFLLASPSAHDLYLVGNRPTVMVVDGERRVQLASFGHEAERLVRTLVRERLGDGD